MRSAIIATGLAAGLLVPQAALACGGFFCGGTPIDQTGEDILFAVDGRNIETHVRISYAGDAEAFSWVVPVPGVPELEIGSDALFDTLASVTSPSFMLEVGDYSCNGPYTHGYWGDDELDSDGGPPSPTDNTGANPGVEVLAEVQVGAYEAVVLGATNSQALLDWLNCNGYRIAQSALPRVEAYLADNQNFLGLKLSNGYGTGDLAPIVMKYVAPRPVIPLVLTAVATSPNLRIRSYFLGDSRAVPYNFDHVWVNDARINWASGGWWAGPWNNNNEYESLVGRAVDEAGGNAFVTDFAGTATLMENRIYPGAGYDVDSLRQYSDPAEFVQNALWLGLPRNATMQNLLRRHIPMPQDLVDQGVEERDFYNNLNGWAEWLQDLNFDPDAFVDDLNELMLEPMQEAQSLFDGDRYPWLTRMQSTMSGWEMNSDPAFLFVPDAGEIKGTDITSFPHNGAVSRERWAPQDFIGGDDTVSCWQVASVVDTLSGVKPVLQWPTTKMDVDKFPGAELLPSCQELPAAMIVERFDEEGNAQVILDKRADIQAAAELGFCVPGMEEPQSTDPPADVTWPPEDALMPLVDLDKEYCAELEANGTDLPGDNPADDTPEDAASCASSGCAAAGGGSWLALVMLGAVRRRRD
jgi:hypothetical protein